MSELRLDIHVVDRLSRAHLCLNFALVAYADMLHLDLADREVGWPMHPSDAAVAAFIETEIVGIMPFDSEDLDRATVRWAYVLSDYRRRGIFRLMLDELIKWCERNGRLQVEFDVPLRNAGAGRALVAVGGKAVSQRHRIEV